jgi:SAM-dependent methyltransferase
LDKAGEQYWTKVWGGTRLPVPIRVHGRGPRAWFYREFHHLWKCHLPPAGEGTKRLLEIGCAQSRWLPYFAREWGYAVAGLDYSELGCLQSRTMLAREGIDAEIFHQDLFCPALPQLASFDLVFTNGVVEHFEDTGAVLRQMAAYLKPGGLMITIVPNLAGWLGRLQKLVSPEVMAIHRPLTREELAEAHVAAGLRPHTCNYLAFLHFSVVNSGDRWRGWRKSCFFKGLKGATALARTLRQLCPGLPSDRRTAGYIVCIAAKAAAKKHCLKGVPKSLKPGFPHHIAGPFVC